MPKQCMHDEDEDGCHRCCLSPSAERNLRAELAVFQSAEAGRERELAELRREATLLRAEHASMVKEVSILRSGHALVMFEWDRNPQIPGYGVRMYNASVSSLHYTDKGSPR